MNEKTKLILALMQVDNLFKLIEGNEWETHLTRNLISFKIELERQLSHYE
ncbi:hypothetical protein [Synechococcus phage DSL-LC02]|nr:hypothetical protein [Synechococcus phage DSL-LC02]